MQIKNKKVGLIVTGAAPVEDKQYELIENQFACITEYLGWDMLFQKRYSASERDELAKNEAVMAELEELGKEL